MLLLLLFWLLGQGEEPYEVLREPLKLRSLTVYYLYSLRDRLRRLRETTKGRQDGIDGLTKIETRSEKQQCTSVDLYPPRTPRGLLMPT